MYFRHTPPDPMSQPPPMTNYEQSPHFSMNYPQNPMDSGLVQTWSVSGIKIDVSLTSILFIFMNYIFLFY